MDGMKEELKEEKNHINEDETEKVLHIDENERTIYSKSRIGGVFRFGSDESGVSLAHLSGDSKNRFCTLSPL